MPDILERYHQQQARLTDLEPRYVPKVRAALLRSIERAVVAHEQGAAPAVAAAFVAREGVSKVLSRLYADAGVGEAQITYDYLTGDQKAAKALAPPALVSRWAERLARFITTEGAAAVKGITETTRKLVRDVLQEAADAGDGVAVAAKKLRERVAGVAQERAVKIVRTELVSASAYGSLLGAQATGLNLDKCWLATPGSRTRVEHQAANGQRASLQDGFFIVGGEHARYPADPMLSAAMRINCRCSIIFKLKESHN